MVPNNAKRLIYGSFLVLFYTRLNTKYCTAVLPITQLDFILADILVYFSFVNCLLSIIILVSLIVSQIAFPMQPLDVLY